MQNRIKYKYRKGIKYKYKKGIKYKYKNKVRIKSFHLSLPSYVSINSSALRTHYTHGYKCKIGLNTNIERESNTNTKRESNTNTKTK